MQRYIIIADKQRVSSFVSLCAMGKKVRSEAQRIKRNRRRHKRPPDLEVSVFDEPLAEGQESHAPEELHEASAPDEAPEPLIK